MPGELNFFPLYRHRLDPDGTVLELDTLWPLFHFERRNDGGSDFRIRPFYRRIEEGERNDGATPITEHQFLWPLGRVRSGGPPTSAQLSRLFPLWWYQSHINDKNQLETDWFVTPLLWGGSSEDGSEDYLMVLPFYGDAPGWLSYDRFQTILFPLYVHLEYKGDKSYYFPWLLAGYGHNDEGRHWHRVLPFYSVDVDKGQFERYTALWPFVHWGVEDLDTDDPVHQTFLFPLYGTQESTSGKSNAWTVLWPFFQKTEIEDEWLRLDLAWPIFRYLSDSNEDDPIHQWWIWPLVSRTVTKDQRAWSFLWPLIWLSQYDDPQGQQNQTWVLPFYWRIHRDRNDGTEDDFIKIWPLLHHQSDHDGSGNWSALSPWPWRASNAYGVEEMYGWIWSLAKGRWTPDDSSVQIGGHLFSKRERHGRRQMSVPFLFNYEDHAQGEGGTFRLFQFIPIPVGGGH